MTGKKRIFAGMGILLGVLVGVQGTAAYQSAYDKAVNIVTPGNISSEIGEDFPNPPTIVPDKDIDIAKKIWVSNNPSGQNKKLSYHACRGWRPRQPARSDEV